MLRLASDENFNGEVVRGLLRREPTLDIVRVQDADLLGAEDPEILAWAAEEGRVLLTHDRATMPMYAHERLAVDEPMSGVFVLSDRMAIGQAIEEVLLLADCSEPDEWDRVVLYLPL